MLLLKGGFGEVVEDLNCKVNVIWFLILWIGGGEERIVEFDGWFYCCGLVEREVGVCCFFV